LGTTVHDKGYFKLYGYIRNGNMISSNCSAIGMIRRPMIWISNTDREVEGNEMSSLKEQYEQMLADEAKQKEAKSVSAFGDMKNVLKNAGCFLYELKKDDQSVEAAELVLPEKWRALSGYTSSQINEHLVFHTLKNAKQYSYYEIDLDVVAQVRADDGKHYMAATLSQTIGAWQSNSFCKTTPEQGGGFRPFAKNDAKKKCLQKAEECMGLIKNCSQGSQLFVMDKVEIERSDSGVPHYQSTILFKDGSYHVIKYGVGSGGGWLGFLKRVNGK